MRLQTVSCAFAVFAAAAICAVSPQNVFAQAKMQGQTVNSPPPASSSPPTQPTAAPQSNGGSDKAAAPESTGKPMTTKERRAACRSEGKDQGLKGRKLRKYVKKCMKKPASM
jgi:hypothetical protein